MNSWIIVFIQKYIPISSVINRGSFWYPFRRNKTQIIYNIDATWVTSKKSGI